MTKSGPGARAHIRVAVDELGEMGEDEGEGEVGGIVGQDVGRVGDAHASRAPS
ncbi:MAG TPA: hypothetical protein VJY34_02740 [Roseiarcus sp.]|nr:hypothetical protein [Roseiarcus sp.]